MSGSGEQGDVLGWGLEPPPESHLPPMADPDASFPLVVMARLIGLFCGLPIRADDSSGPALRLSPSPP
ncbi:hypothetical protein F7725_023195, partial [Dissostichus mawsoni]